MKRPRTSKVSRKTSSSSSSAAEILGSIDDLLIQVFLRLPVKQLCRFKLVSKHWNSIISDPKLPLFLRKPEPAVGLIFQYRVHDPHRFFIPLKSKIVYFNQPGIPKPMGEPFGRGAKVLHSCNGLLLCRSVFGYRRHHIYNPMTKKSSTLDPGTGEGFFSSSVLGMFLAFDPSESCHYKLVCVLGLGKHSWIRPQKCDRFKFEVYSSETDSWRRCGEPFSASVDFKKGGVYWKGANHWLSLTKLGKSIYFNPCGDDDRMLPTVMPSPSPPTLNGLEMERNYHFGESFGHLHFVVAPRRVFEFNVYEMKSDYSEWFVKYTVDLSFVKHRLDSDLFTICTLVRETRTTTRFWLCGLGENSCGSILLARLLKQFWSVSEQKRKKEFPNQYIEGAFGNIDGVWVTETEARTQNEF